MKLLITGGAGFIGSHLADYFASNNHEVVVVDNLFHGFKKNLPKNTRLYTIDISDKQALLSIMKTEQPEVVSHYAATIAQASTDNANDYSTDIAGTMALLEACSLSNVKHLLFASSAAVYGSTTTFPTPETTTARPINKYGESKLKIEQLIGDWSKTFSISITVFRYGNVYGPRQRSGVIPSYVKKVRQHKPLVIEDSGTQTRDFVHISDVVSANAKAIFHQGYGTYNISSGTETSILELASMFNTLSNRSPNFYVTQPIKIQQIQRSMLSPLKAKTELSWEPKTTLEQGLTQLINTQ